MKMYAVKETVIANLICAVIECEHGKVEIVFEGWGVGFEDKTAAQYLKRYVIDYHSDNLQLYEVKDEDFCQGDFKQVVMNFVSCAPYVPFDWDEIAPTLADYSEIYQLLSSAMAYVNTKLYNS